MKSAHCVMKYREHPTYISSEITDQREAEFPAVTVCSPSNGYKLDILRVSYIFECIILIKRDKYMFTSRTMDFQVCPHTIYIKNHGLAIKLK